jgi:hypothetical protein
MIRRVKKREKSKGQSIVEFALVLPITLLIVFGVIEFGYFLFVYSSVNTASRDAARYGIAVGEGDTANTLRYYDCAGIIAAGTRIGKYAGILESEFTIRYDHGPGTSNIYPDPACTTLASYGGDDLIEFGDRIVVTVAHPYEPLITYMGLDLGSFTMTSISSRSIVKGAQILLSP